MILFFSRRSPASPKSDVGGSFARLAEVRRRRVIRHFFSSAPAAVLSAFVPSCVSATGAPQSPTALSPPVNWLHGPPSSSGYFPIGVWLQDPSNAERFRKAGFNIYVGLWQGPTEDQLAALKKAGMSVICEQNDVGLRHRDDPVIVGWMGGDEPDNAQSWGARLGWGPPVAPAKIVQQYERMRSADPSRPVLLNLGQGVAWDDWYGRGTRNHHPEDYPQYIEGCDIASFDIYPVVHPRAEVAGKLWYVAQGVERLVAWTGGKKIVWNVLECTHIENPGRKPTPRQVRCEAWMSLIHGSRGLIFFVHQFKPVFREAALLDDPEMLAAVAALNRQITELAPVLNSPTVLGEARVVCDNPAVPVATMLKRNEGNAYLFAVSMREGATTAVISIKGVEGAGAVEVLGENRSLTARNGAFTDHFDSWDAHLYRLRPRTPGP
jgi:hypothetical protein